jgi:hypothetical protein
VVYIYLTSNGGLTWSENKILTASDGIDGDAFGWAVSIQQSFIVVGANKEDDNGGNRGNY